MMIILPYIDNREDSEDTINIELSNMYQWSASNKLSLNIKNTKFMVFYTTKTHIEYSDLNINGIAIEKIIIYVSSAYIYNKQ